jgi:hypothetical protein
VRNVRSVVCMKLSSRKDRRRAIDGRVDVVGDSDSAFGVSASCS